MKVRDLFRLLANEDLDAEVMVSVDMMLSRSDPRPGVLIVPTRCVEAGRFVDGSMAGQPWVSVIGTDAWGLSPGSPPKHDVVPSDPLPGLLQVHEGVGLRLAAQIIFDMTEFYQQDSRGLKALDDVRGAILERAGLPRNTQGSAVPAHASAPSSCPVPMVGRAWDCSQCKRRIWDNEQDHHVTPWACPYGCGSTSRLVRATPFTRAAKKAEHG